MEGDLIKHTDPEHRLGFFECLTGSEELLAITACVQNIYKKNWNVSISTFLEICPNFWGFYLDPNSSKFCKKKSFRGLKKGLSNKLGS